MDDIDIESATTEDADAIAELWVSLAADQRRHDSHILSGENRARIRESIVRHVVNDQLLVAVGTEIVGFVMFSVESGSYEQDVRRGVVENIYVVPARRGEGIGSALLATAERRLQNQGIDVVTLEMMAGNRQAREFYREAGYEPHRVQLEKPVESDTHSKGDE